MLFNIQLKQLFVRGQLFGHRFPLWDNSVYPLVFQQLRHALQQYQCVPVADKRDSNNFSEMGQDEFFSGYGLAIHTKSVVIRSLHQDAQCPIGVTGHAFTH